MKKYRVIIMLFCGLIQCLFAVDWQKELFGQFIQDKTFVYYFADAGGVGRIEQELEIIATDYNTGRDDKRTVALSDFTLNENGFLTQKITASNYSTKKKQDINMFFVLGNEYLIYFISKEDFNSGYCLTMITPNSFKGREKSDFWKLINKYRNYVDTNPYSWLIKKMTMSSFMSETVKGVIFPYNGSDFEVYMLHDKVGSSLNPYAIPWVENVEGGGIGEWIEVEPEKEQRICYILNGFVDASRPHLYKMNSRIKEALVTGTTAKGKELTQTVYFEDFAYFKTIQFTKPVVKIRITIQDVYPGSKWQDTAISAVMFPNRLGTSSAECSFMDLKLGADWQDIVSDQMAEQYQ